MPFNPFNPDGSWNWDAARNSSDDEVRDAWEKAHGRTPNPGSGPDMSKNAADVLREWIAAEQQKKAAEGYSNVWAKKERRKKQPESETWDSWFRGRSEQEREAYSWWKKDYVKFNEMTSPPGENWFRNQWDKEERHTWHKMQNNQWYKNKPYIEILAFRDWEIWHKKTQTQYTMFGNSDLTWHQRAWDASIRMLWKTKVVGRGFWGGREQEERSQSWGFGEDPFEKKNPFEGRFNQRYSWYEAFKNAYENGFNEQSGKQSSQDSGYQSGKKKITLDQAKKFIRENLEQFMWRFNEYCAKEHRMAMNALRIAEGEIRAKEGTVTVGPAPELNERLKTRLRKDVDAGLCSLDEAVELLHKVYPEAEIITPLANKVAEHLLSPLSYGIEYSETVYEI